MQKKISIIVLILLMLVTLFNSNTKINVVNAEDETSCSITVMDLLYREVDRDIVYVYENGTTAKPTVNQVASFDGTVTFDNVTGLIVNYGSFVPESATLEAVESPEIVGYLPDKDVVNERLVAANGQSHFREVVTYSPVPQKMQVLFKEGDNVLQTINENGRTDDPFTYDPTNDIAEWTRKGFEVVENGYPSDGIYDNVDDTNEISQIYVISLQKRTMEDQEEKTVTRTIHYRLNNQDGVKLAEDVVQKQVFDRTVSISGLDITYGPWNPASFEFEAVNSPELEDLVPSRAVVDAVTVTGDSENIEEWVIYTEVQQQLAKIKIIDVDAGDEELFRMDVPGESNTPIGYNVQPKLEEYSSLGYELAEENPYNPEILFDEDDTVDQEFIIKLKHGIMDVPCDDDSCEVPPPCRNTKDPECDLTPEELDPKYLKVVLRRVIEYKYAEDNSEAAPSKTQDITFTRDGHVDRVTGRVWYDPITPESLEFVLVNSPEILGYTASEPFIAAKLMSAIPDAAENIPQDEPLVVINELVTYNRAPQNGIIHFKNDRGEDLPGEVQFSGGSLEDFPASAKEDKDTAILNFIKNGYELVSDEYEAETNKKFDSDSEVDQEYVVTLKEREVIIPYDDPKKPGDPACEEPCQVPYPEGVTEGDLNKEYTRIIHHVDKEDIKLLDDATQTAAERFTYKYNLVTRVLTLIDTKIENYPEYKTPDIEKMSKDRDVVPADERLENLEEKVVYTKITYKVTFIDGLTGEELKVEIVEPGDDATAPEIPVHENYKAGEWDKDFTNVQQDLIVTIPYTPVTKPVCVVKFVDGLTGKTIDTQQIECGTGAKDPGKPEHENYITGDWDKPFDKVEVPELIVTVNYERKKCKVIFVDSMVVDDGNKCNINKDTKGVIKEVEYFCGDEVPVPEAPKHDGYEFIGWEKIECKLLIIYAKYKKITVKPMVPTGSWELLEAFFNLFR